MMNLIFYTILCQYLHERSYHLDTYVIYNSNNIYKNDNNHNDNHNNHHFPDKKNHSHVLDFNHDQKNLQLLVVFLFTTVFTVVLCSFKGVKYNFRENVQIQDSNLDIENRYITATGSHNVNNIQNVEGEIVVDDESINSDQIVNGRIVSLH